MFRYLQEKFYKKSKQKKNMLNPCKISVNFLFSPAKKYPDGFTLSGCFLPIKSLQFPNVLLRRAEKAEHGGHID